MTFKYFSFITVILCFLYCFKIKQNYQTLTKIKYEIIDENSELENSFLTLIFNEEIRILQLNVHSKYALTMIRDIKNENHKIFIGDLENNYLIPKKSGMYEMFSNKESIKNNLFTLVENPNDTISILNKKCTAFSTNDDSWVIKFYMTEELVTPKDLIISARNITNFRGFPLYIETEIEEYKLKHKVVSIKEVEFKEINKFLDYIELSDSELESKVGEVMYLEKQVPNLYLLNFLNI